MVRQQVTVVHLVDVVTRQDDDVLRTVVLDEVEILVGGVGGAAVPVRVTPSLVGLEKVHSAVHAVQVPGLAALDVVVQ